MFIHSLHHERAAGRFFVAPIRKAHILAKFKRTRFFSYGAITVTLWFCSVFLVMAEPLSTQQLIVLIKSGLESKELQEQIRKNGYAGGNDAPTLKQLRDAGADADLIVFLAQFNSPAVDKAPAPEKAPVPPAQDDALRSPTDEEIKLYLEERYDNFGNLGRIEASQLGITDKDKVEQFVKDYCVHNGRRPYDAYYDSNGFDGRCSPILREGKFGYSLKGQVVAEYQWDHFVESFNKTGSGTVTLYKFTPEGAALIREFSKTAAGDLAKLEAQNMGGNELSTNAWILHSTLRTHRTYKDGSGILDIAKAKKINVFASSSSITIPPSDDPCALIQFEKNGKFGLLNSRGVVYPSDKRPDFFIVRLLPVPDDEVEKAVSKYDWYLKQEASQWNTSIYHKNFREVLLDNFERVVDHDIISEDNVLPLLSGRSLWAFEQFCDGKFPRSIYLTFEKQNDTTWRAKLSMIKTVPWDNKKDTQEMWGYVVQRMAPLEIKKSK